ncbi:MAG: sulfatase [Balneolaceae bacterium]|nr:sulfatase [Balneolaceae bacterium]
MKSAAFMVSKKIALLIVWIILIGGCAGEPENIPRADLETAGLETGESPRNVIFILSDDHRYDFMGFTGRIPYLETPNMDRMAHEGAHLVNAFVTTSLCSPSRASILTGQYTHRHGVVDNSTSVPDSAMFFPQYLQDSGYETAFVGKWHMGRSSDKPRRGFDYWVSFRGQGSYYNPTLNENGTRTTYGDSTYITDLLTDKALAFLENRNGDKPFFLYLSHKAVHAGFKPAPRHRGVYKNKSVEYPPSMFPPGFNLEDTTGKGYRPERSDIPSPEEYRYEDLPDWVKEQRYSWHGVDYMYHGGIQFDQFYQNYLETVLGIDESIGRVIRYLGERGLMENTVLFYMGDNGFSFGEHGLIDKRHAYEESIRVPLLAYAPGYINSGTDIRSIVQNIDIAPTIMEIAGLSYPKSMDGLSFAGLLEGRNIPWRDKLYYEYFWEKGFPQTPTVHAVRTDSFKYIRYYGIWDINELYNLAEDPWEMNNLIREEQYLDLQERLNRSIFDWLKRTDGMKIPLRPDHRDRFDHKYRNTW